MLKITIVTVCLNAENSIEKTILSVINQTYPNVEYIVQDGQSTDNTLNIVKKYQATYSIQVYSEKDTGLYQAMNRAIYHASGDYILFLNSNDVLCNDRVLEKIAMQLQYDIVMGNVIRIKEHGEQIEKYGSRRKVFLMLLSGRMPCHQVIFARRELLLELGGFQEKYTICADFDFMVRCCKRKATMYWADIDTSIVDCITGISSQNDNLNKMRYQDDMSIKENYPVWYQLMKPLKFLKRKVLY